MEQIAERERTAEHKGKAQHHPIRLYLKVWGLLFVLSTLSFLVDFFHVQELLKRFLVSAFALMKAGLIVSVFMHLRFERLSLIYAILLPPLLLLALVGIMVAEGDYVVWVRQLFFGP